jgi:uncharacterized membrane protein YphA (DoxX/SURF4 family)
MRSALIVIGIVLLVAGIWIVVGHGSYETTDTVVKLGPAQITATHDKSIPSWVGIAGIVVGALLAIGGFVKKR